MVPDFCIMCVHVVGDFCIVCVHVVGDFWVLLSSDLYDC